MQGRHGQIYIILYEMYTHRDSNQDAVAFIRIHSIVVKMSDIILNYWVGNEGTVATMTNCPSRIPLCDHAVNYPTISL